MHRIYFGLCITFSVIILITVFQNLITGTPAFFLTTVLNGGILILFSGVFGAGAGVCFLLYYLAKRALADQGEDSSTV